MKICQVLGGNEMGGLEKHFIELCSRLATRHEVVAIAHPVYRSFIPSNVHFEAINLNLSRKNPIARWQLARAIRRHQPDIVHAHANKAAALVSSIRPFIRATRVATIHSLKRNTRMFMNFDRVIAVSQATSEQLTGVESEVIYNGIVPPVVPEGVGKESLCREFLLTGERPVLIAVGRLVDVKGFDLLLAAMQEIEADLLIAGDGSGREDLERFVARFSLGDRVKFIGYREDIPTLLAGADLVVISSRKEGFPYVLTEALHVRQAVLSTRVPGAAEILPAEMLVPCNSSLALKKGILNYIENKEKILPLFEPVWDFAVSHLTLDVMVQKIEHFYCELLNCE